MVEKKSKKRMKRQEFSVSTTEFPESSGRITRRSGIGPGQAGMLNRRLVLDMMRRSGGMSRADLTRETGLTPQATSGIVARLVKGGYLTEIARRTGGRGYPSRIYAIKADGAYAFGASLESNRLTVVLINLAGDIVAKDVTHLAKTQPAITFAAIRDISDTQLKTTGVNRKDVVGLGLGIPGRFDPERAILIPPTFNPEWQDVPVAETLRKLLGLPVYWDNDANAAAIGECFRGVGVDFQNLVYLHIGRGFGSGLILNGEPFRGSEGNAGEIGRTRVSLPDLSDKPVRLSQVATIKALNRRLRKAGKSVSDPQNLTKSSISRDVVIRDWLDDTADAITQVLCSVIYTLDIEAIVVGGILSDDVADQLVARIRPGLDNSLYHWNKAPIVVRGTVGPDAGALGAATIPLFTVFSARA